MNNLSVLTASQRASSGKEQHLAYSLSVVGAAFLIGYLFSLWYLYIYYLGDQEHYARFYYSLYGMDPQYWKMLQKNHLGSAEPLYRYIIGVAAYFGVDRIQYLSIWNGVLTASVGYSLLKYRSSLLFAALAFTNYYFMVLLGSAERLKFAYIFLILGFCVNSIKPKYIISILSIFFHTQAVIQILSSSGYYFSKNYKAIFLTPLRTVLVLAGTLISLSVVGFLFWESVGDVIALKSEGYAEKSRGAAEIIQWALLLVAGLYVFRYKIAFTIAMLPMGVFTFLYGNRVNVATFVLFAMLAMVQRKTNHPIVLAVMAYMSFKSITFIADVMKYGTGYP